MTVRKSWKRIPSDGTSWAYWEKPGFQIETKPRFRHCPYTLDMTGPGDNWPIPFDTLALAKAAAELPLETLRSMQREAYLAYHATWAGMTAGNASIRIHEDAIEEDWMRTERQLHHARSNTLQSTPDVTSSRR